MASFKVYLKKGVLGTVIYRDETAKRANMRVRALEELHHPRCTTSAVAPTTPNFIEVDASEYYDSVALKRMKRLVTHPDVAKHVWGVMVCKPDEQPEDGHLVTWLGVTPLYEEESQADFRAAGLQADDDEGLLYWPVKVTSGDAADLVDERDLAITIASKG